MRYAVIVGILISFFITQIAFAQPVINEVYPKTPEWAEIWNVENETLNLSQWNISDADSSDTITCSGITNCSLITNETYFLILGNSTNITQVTNESVVYFYVDDATIANNLNDDGDNLSFYNGSYSSNMTYNSSTAGHSWALIDDNWTLCSTPTPGSANNCTVAAENQNVELAVNLNSSIFVNMTHDGIFNISVEGKSNCSVLDNITIAYNITQNSSLVREENVTVEIGCIGTAGNWTPNATGEYEICGLIQNSTANNTNTSDDNACMNITVTEETIPSCELSVSITTPAILNFSTTSALSYNITINDSACSNVTHAINVTYQIDDLFGNSTRSPYTTNTNMTCSEVLERIWSSWPSFSGSEAFLIKANITALGCNDTNSTNDYIEKMFVIKSNTSAQCQNVTVVSSSSGGGSCPTTTQTEGEDSNFFFFSVPDEVRAGQAFDVVVRLTNNASTSRVFTLYSYVFNGSKLLSDGARSLSASQATDDMWGRDWESNTRNITISANESASAILVNKVRSDTAPSIYRLRVRIKDVRDLTRSIIVTNTTISTCPACNCTIIASVNETTDTSFNRTRRVISQEDPIETIKNVVGSAVTGFATGTQELITLVAERIPKPDPMVGIRIATESWDGFIWAIEQMIRSS